MAANVIEVPQIGPVYIYQRRSARNLRISIGSEGRIQVSLPYGVSKRSALHFVNSKRDWILDHQRQKKVILADGNRIGKAHYLRFVTHGATKPSGRVINNEVRIYLPQSVAIQDIQAQATARTTSLKALRQQANQLLPQRLNQLSMLHELPYKGVTIRHMRSRWGSCNSEGRISLNLFLVQLPWQLIDYVMLHELIHTKILHHSPLFWSEFERYLPGAKQLRNSIREYQATIIVS